MTICIKVELNDSSCDVGTTSCVSSFEVAPGKLFNLAVALVIWQLNSRILIPFGMLSRNIIIRLIFLLFLKHDSSWWMLRSLTAWCLSLWKLRWFCAFLLITTKVLLFRFLGDDADFLFWQFAVCNWWTWPTSSLLGSSTVRRLNMFDVLIWKPMSLPSFVGFFRFTTSFCKGELHPSEHLLLRFCKLPHL